MITVRKNSKLAILLCLVSMLIMACIPIEPSQTEVQGSTTEAMSEESTDNDDGDAEDDVDESDDNDDSEKGVYSIDITPADFVARIDNPYFPLTPGSRWVYEANLEDGSVERIELEILSETHDVNGVAATILHDSAYLNGELIEETFDWYAQDNQGNVWYLGETVDNYEDGVLMDHDGSWAWGEDGALPGIYMWADPSAHIDETYYQEYYPGEAEDIGQVLSVDGSMTVPFGTFDNVIQTYDFSSLEAELQEHKFYVARIGVIREVDLISGEEVLLIEYTPAAE